jgi:hypothetical protein
MACNAISVGAVYDRAFFVEFHKKQAVIDRPYRKHSGAGGIDVNVSHH